MLESSLSIIVAYLLGSTSSAYIVGRLAGKIDMRSEPDGRISAAEIHHKLGILPFSCVVIGDVALPILAVAIANLLTGSTTMMMVAGFAAVCGHNWSVFLKFKGGLGATAILGALAPILLLPTFYGLVIAGIMLLTTHRSSLSFGLGIFGISIAAFVQSDFGLLGTYPLILSVLMILKKYQVSRMATPAS